MIHVKQSKFSDLSFSHKRDLEKLVQTLPIQNYREVIKKEVSSVIYGTNDKNEIITCLFITKSNEIIFYRTKTSLQGRGFGSTIMILVTYMYKELSICTSNENVVKFLLKNGFEIVEEQKINILANFQLDFLKNEKNLNI